jgi:hypothetical protein
MTIVGVCRLLVKESPKQNDSPRKLSQIDVELGFKMVLQTVMNLKMDRVPYLKCRQQ